MLFSDFDEKMRILYENELITNLTTLNNNIEGLKDEELSKEYGVDVIDFSDKKYCLAYHVKSKFENYDELINGLSTRDKSTICLSIGSNRNQIVYHKNGLIFATDELPNGVFIRSSTHNMGSNGTIKKGSFKDIANNSIREQRGALETSIAPYGNNSEVLCFRSGVKFKYIILPGGAKPSNEIIEIAKKYNLKFIKTQNLYESINIPKEIDSRYLKVTDEKLNQHRIDNLRKIKENLIIKNKNMIITYEEKEMNSDVESKENISPENINKTYYEFNINSMVDILSIKWVFKCEKLQNCFVGELSQCIFINPIHNFLLSIGNLITIPNNLMKNSSTGLYNGISIDDAKLMIKCNYLGKKVGFNTSIIDLLNTSSYVVNGVRSSIDRNNEENEDENKGKKKQQINKKKFWGPMKHRKGEKVIFCEEAEEKITQTCSTEALTLNEKMFNENDISLSQKESNVIKDKKKKKKHFI